MSVIAVGISEIWNWSSQIRFNTCNAYYYQMNGLMSVNDLSTEIWIGVLEWGCECGKLGLKSATWGFEMQDKKSENRIEMSKMEIGMLKMQDKVLIQGRSLFIQTIKMNI